MSKPAWRSQFPAEPAKRDPRPSPGWQRWYTRQLAEATTRSSELPWTDPRSLWMAVGAVVDVEHAGPGRRWGLAPRRGRAC